MKRTHFQIIRSLADSPKTFWEVSIDCDGLIKDMFVSIKELLDEKIILFKENKFYLADEKKYDYIKKDFKKEFGEFQKIAVDRPSSVMEYFQAEISDDGLLKRMKFIYERGDLVGKDFFILGDDDLFSILIALTGLANRIVVTEIDNRVSDLIKKISDQMNLKIEISEYNCADPLPKEYQHGFDVFITDPVETVPGFRAFMTRGIESLKHPGAAYFGLSEIECSPKSWHIFQKRH